jgi:hypothetical protein
MPTRAKAGATVSGFGFGRIGCVVNARLVTDAGNLINFFLPKLPNVCVTRSWFTIKEEIGKEEIGKEGIGKEEACPDSLETALASRQLDLSTRFCAFRMASRALICNPNIASDFPEADITEF